MVTYQVWTSLAFEVARIKGATFQKRRSDRPPEDASNLISIAADIWQEDKERYLQMTRAEARSVLMEEIDVA